MIKYPYFFLLALVFITVPWVLQAQTEGMTYHGKKITVEQCLQLADQQLQAGDIKEATRFINQAAAIYWNQKGTDSSAYKMAIQYFERSLKLNQDIGNENGVSMLSNNLGMLYADIKQYEKSLSYFQKTLKVRRKMREKIGIINALINISVDLNNLKRYEESALALEEALTLAIEKSDAALIRSCYGQLAETYRYLNNKEKFKEYFEKYRAMHVTEERTKKDMEEKHALETTQLQLKILQAQVATKEQELELLRKEKKLEAQELEISHLDAATRKLMTDSSKQALAIQVLGNQDKIKTLELKKKQAELEHEAFIKQLLLFGLGIILFLSSFLLVFYIQKRKKNQLLFLRTAKIEEQTKEIERQHLAILQQNQTLIEAQTIIKEQNKKLIDYNHILEDQVEERTQQLKQTNSELIEQNTQLEQYGYMTAHNLRGPVARILGLVSILNTKEPADHANQFILENVQKETNHLDSVIQDMNQILDIRKGIRNNIESINLLERVTSALQNFQADLESIGGFVSLQIPDSIVIDFVKAYLDSILYNCISNAIKYRNPRRKLVIKIEAQTLADTFVRLCIHDNGLGIDLNLHGNKIFGLYKRFHSHREGKGLGLYLIKAQMEALEGKIEIQSRVNEGTTLQLLFKQAKVANNSILEQTMTAQ